MKNSIIYMTLLVFLSLNISTAQPPKREVRGAWIVSLFNNDWPSAAGLAPSIQKNELVNMLDELKDIGINTAMFHIRPECDALYDSPYEPWSFWLTGQQGLAPDPYYDPLEFAVNEAHKRGMELHAWFNPYRAEAVIGNYSLAASHVVTSHPDWILTFSPVNLNMMDPGIPQVRQHIINVIMDVVNRYDIDGVHFDDYFYPYPNRDKAFIGITTEDNATFAAYPRGFTDQGAWRRDNVNLLVAMVYDSIQIVKPHVKFGISPFGIWKNNVPSGIIGLDTYNDIYCDALAWLSAQTVDYLTPQLYWPFGGDQDYGTLLPWWASYAGLNSRHLYPGQAAYRMSPSEKNWPVSELVNQIDLNRNTDNVYGSVFFRTKKGLTDNIKGFADTLVNNLYRKPAFQPVLDWKETVPPNPPQNVQYSPIAERKPYILQWGLPATASDGDSASRYALYRKANDLLQQADIEDSQYLFDVTGIRQISLSEPETMAQNYYYAVTSLDRNNNESDLSNVIPIVPPAYPVLVYPENDAQNQPDSTILRWAYVDSASAYHLQVAEDSNFISIQRELNSILDTSTVMQGLNGQVQYYWRVASSNPAGHSDFSDIFSFTTGFPGQAPFLVFPEDLSSDLPLDTTLIWQSDPLATMYRLQLAKSEFFNSNIVLDTVLSSDTTLFVRNLEPFTRQWYYWRVKSLNEFGGSDWSETWQFRTIISSLGTDDVIAHTYDLKQNYPNPFNPSTSIQYSIAEPGFVSLRIYNTLGQEVAVVVEGELVPGQYTAEFEASRLSTGIYIYQLRSKGYTRSRKMMLIK
jgi:uncharacterized lipoprotein YddW (UPF0748 family)